MNIKKLNLESLKVKSNIEYESEYEENATPDSIKLHIKTMMIRVIKSRKTMIIPAIKSRKTMVIWVIKLRALTQKLYDRPLSFLLQLL